MAKKEISIEVSGIEKEPLYINEVKMRGLSKDMQKQLDVIAKSLNQINDTLTKLVNKKVVTGNRVDSYKSWAKRAKAQSIAAEKLIQTLEEKTNEDYQLYPIRLLDERIAELEKKIASLTVE